MNEEKILIKTLFLDKEGKTLEINEFLSQEYSKKIEEDHFKFSKKFDLFSIKTSKTHEYILKLVHPTPEKLESLLSQLKYRLQDGNGEAYYELGIEENGNPLGLSQDDMHSSLS